VSVLSGQDHTPAESAGASPDQGRAGMQLNFAVGQRINMNPTLLIFLFLFSPSIAIADSSSVSQNAREKAKEFNVKGYRLHKIAKYLEASTYFEKAIANDPNDSKYHYNLACAWSRFYENRGRCFSLNRYVILEPLKKAIHLDSSRQEKMRTDPDLRYAREIVGFQLLNGLSPAEPSELTALLENTLWYAGSTEMSGPRLGLDFSTGGQVRLLDYPRKESATPSPTTKVLAIGQYRLDKSEINIEFMPKVSLSMDGDISEIGKLSGKLTVQIRESEYKNTVKPITTITPLEAQSVINAFIEFIDAPKRINVFSDSYGDCESY
jgi:hypothetical protein